MRKITLVNALTVAAAFAVFVPASSLVAAPEQHQHEQQAQAAQGRGMKMDGMKHGEMKMDDMMAQKKANTERINALMAQINNSTGDRKIAAMADVIAVLLEERAAMQAHCATACSMMKQ